MACNERKILESIIIDGEGYTPQDEWTVTIGGVNKEMTRHLNSTVSVKSIPEIDVASGGILFESVAKADQLIAKCGFNLTLAYTGNTSVQLNNCVVTGHSTLETDGYMTLEISGIAG